MFTMENFVKGLNAMTHGCTFEEDEDGIILIAHTLIHYRDASRMELRVKYSKAEIEQLLGALQNASFENYAVIKDETFFETAVSPLDKYSPVNYYIERNRFDVEDHNYKLSISKATNDYMTALICTYGAAANSDAGLQAIFHINYHFATRDGTSFIDFLNSFRMVTAQIQAPVGMKSHQFHKILNSYLYNISYNYDIVFAKMDFKEERYRVGRRVSRSGQLFPYKSFNGELVKYYHQAMTSDMPITEYLAYYHVAEFFFQSIAESEALSEIEQIITRPSFTPHKKEDIRKFYDKVKKIMSNQREDGMWDERNGLLSCLKKYVPDLNDLKETINSLDSNAADYYKNNEIAFASTAANTQSGENVKINFDETPEKTYKAIRNRVYLVRNAIVHGKEGERLRYEPFRHDKELQKEIPLIRAIAEEIIINSSKPLEIEYHL